MRQHRLPDKLHGIWTKLERDYRTTAADMATASLHGLQSEELCDTYTCAIDAVLLTPAEAAADIRLKIEVIRDHEVMDDWWCAKEAIALLAIDAARILPTERKGGAA